MSPELAPTGVEHSPNAAASPSPANGVTRLDSEAHTLDASATGNANTTTTSNPDASGQPGGDSLPGAGLTALGSGALRPAARTLTTPADDLRCRAAVLRGAGQEDLAVALEHAAAELTKRDAELAAKDRELAARKAKAIRRAKVDERRVAHDPEADTKYDRVAGRSDWFDILSFLIGLLFLDTGPSDNAGGVQTPAGLFERWMRKEATRHPSVRLTDAFVIAITHRIETKVDDRFLTLRSIFARIANRRHWFDLVRAHQLNGARDRKATDKWLDVFTDAPADPDVVDAPTNEPTNESDPSNANTEDD